jgi:hypothetical protein
MFFKFIWRSYKCSVCEPFVTRQTSIRQSNSVQRDLSISLSTLATCMNHGALQGTYHWDFYRHWGPARYLSLRLVWTMGSFKTNTQEHALHFWLCHIDHDGHSPSLLVLTVTQLTMTMIQISFPDRYIFFAAMSRLSNQPTNQLTNEPNNQTNLLHYFYVVQDFHKACSFWVVKTYMPLQNLTVHHHTHKTLHSTHVSASWIKSTAWILFL